MRVGKSKITGKCFFFFSRGLLTGAIKRNTWSEKVQRCFKNTCIRSYVIYFILNPVANSVVRLVMQRCPRCTSTPKNFIHSWISWRSTHFRTECFICGYFSRIVVTKTDLPLCVYIRYTLSSLSELMNRMKCTSWS